MKSLLAISAFVLFTVSCDDMMSPQPKRIYGNFFIGNLHGGNHHYLMFEDAVSSYKYPINWEEIDKVYGNDSVLLVESVLENKRKYYVLRHMEGKVLNKVADSDSINFSDAGGPKGIKQLWTK